MELNLKAQKKSPHEVEVNVKPQCKGPHRRTSDPVISTEIPMPVDITFSKMPQILHTLDHTMKSNSKI